MRILVLVLTAALPTICAQVPAAESEQPFKLSVTAEFVLLDVSVKSAAGAHVAGLTRRDFQVYEDGKLQTLSHFASEDVPVTAGLVIDTSGSMMTKRAEVVTSALAFIAASNPSDEMFIVHFNDGVSLALPPAVPFTGEIEKLRAALSMNTPQGRTALNDALVFSLTHLEQGRRDRRTLVLVSDGGDNSSICKADDVRRKVLESRATIYTIGIYDEGDPDRNPGLLRSLARISGGESFLEVQLSEVNAICRRIASDIRTRYTIGYVPIRSGGQGAIRKLRVTASTPGGRKLVVHARTEYILPPKHQPGDPHGARGWKRGL